ncbi:variable surface protein [Plasmodium gonderi]|uniref:Variable surface protein n=1 Tax=Plasmodium gonderi TaxID=77519 RepID=A0A1Y1JPT4_PLAGO|nr:variable surface protein [Plasmodium gonderi]GAW84230.1 variable surface protein [Plasmodium gonderi]
MANDILLGIIKQCAQCNDTHYQDNKELFDKLDSQLQVYDCTGSCPLRPPHNIPDNNDVKKIYLFLYNNIYDISTYNENHCTCLNVWLKKKQAEYRKNPLTNNYMHLWNDLMNKLFKELHEGSDNCFDVECCNWNPNTSELIFSSEEPSHSIEASSFVSNDLLQKNAPSSFTSSIKYIFSVCITMLISTIFIFFLLYNSSRIKAFLCNNSILKFLIKKYMKKNNSYTNYENYSLDSTTNRINILFLSNNNF